MPTKNIRCTCEHLYQDAMIGPKQRIHVSVEGDNWRCIICGALKDPKGKPIQADAPVQDAKPQPAAAVENPPDAPAENTADPG